MELEIHSAASNIVSAGHRQSSGIYAPGPGRASSPGGPTQTVGPRMYVLEPLAIFTARRRCKVGICQGVGEETVSSQQSVVLQPNPENVNKHKAAALSPPVYRGFLPAAAFLGIGQLLSIRHQKMKQIHITGQVDFNHFLRCFLPSPSSLILVRDAMAAFCTLNVRFSMLFRGVLDFTLKTAGHRANVRVVSGHVVPDACVGVCDGAAAIRARAELDVPRVL